MGGEITVKETKNNPKPVKQKRIWWRVLLAWIGGFLCFPLAVVGAGALMGTVFSTAQVVSMFGGDPEEILGEDYRNTTILQAVMAIAEKASNGGFQTLEDLNEVSPLVETTVNTTLQQIFGGLVPEGSDLPITWDDIKDSSFTASEGSSSTTGSPLADKVLDTITLASLLDTGETELKGIYLYFLYPILKDEGGHDVLDEGGHVVFDKENAFTIQYYVEHGAEAFNNVIDNVVIGDVIDPADNQLLNAMKNWHLGDMADNINTLQVKDIFSQSQLDDSSLLTAIKNWSLGNFGSNDQIDALKIGSLFDLSGAGDLMNTIAEFYIGNLRGYEITVDEDGNLVSRGAAGSFDITDNIYVSDVVSGESKLLDQFKDKSIKDLASITMDDIYLKNLLDQSVYELDPTKPDDYNRVIHSIMDNERHDRYEAAKAAALAASEPFDYTYDQWLALSEDNADYKATIGILTKESTINNLHLGDILDISEGTILNSFKNKTISQLSSITMDDIYLRDLFDEDVYIKSSDPIKAADYNAVLGAVMENERKHRWEDAGSMPDYETWLTQDDNAEYKATAKTLTDPDLLDDIKLKDLLEIEEGTILYSYREKSISELEDFDVNTIKLADIINKDIYVENPLHPEKYNKVIYALMNNERVDRYEAAKAAALAASEPFPYTFEEWLELDPANAEFNATVSTLTESGTIQKLKLSDVMDVDGTLLSSFGNKKISELNTLSMNDIYLRDLFEEGVYKPGVEPAKYNRVIGALMENERVKVYKAAKQAALDAGEPFPYSYNEWLALDPENAKYNATAAIMSDQSAIDALKITDVIDTSTLVPGTTVYNLIHSLEDDDDANIGNLSTKIGNLEMGKLFGLPVDEFGTYVPYASWTTEQKASNPYVLYSLRESTLNSLSTDLTALTVGDAMDVTGTIFDNPAISGCLVSDGEALTNAFKTTLKLNQLIDITPSSPKILQTLGEYTLNGIATRINTLTLGEVMDIDSGSSKLLQALEDTCIFDKDAFQDKINTLTFDDLVDIDGSSPKILQTLSDTAILADGALETRINTLKLSDVIDIYEDDVYKKDEYDNYLDADDNITVNPAEYVLLHEKSSPILLSLKDVYILSGDGLQNKLNNLMIRDVLTEDECSTNNVLKALWNDNEDAGGKGAVKITEIGAKINNVKLIDILANDIYEYYETSGDADGHYDPLVECYHDGYIYQLSDTTYQNKKITGTWWFLLTSKADYDGAPANGLVERYVLVSGKTYTISSMNSLVNNMSYHMQNEKLYALYDAGLLSISDRSILNKNIPITWSGMIPTGYKEMGNMTIKEFVDAINNCPLF